MSTLMIIITIAVYGIALLMWLRYRSYRYLIALLAGHFPILFDPIWQRLYGIQYPADIPSIGLWQRAIPVFMVLSASWLTALPALLLYFGHKQRWWPRHYATGLIAFIGLVLYHIIIQGIAARTKLWSFSTTTGAWGISMYVLMAIMGGVVSLLILFILVTTRYYAPETAIPTIVGGTVLANLLVYGILGAPFWLPRLIGQTGAFSKIGVGVTLLMMAWVVHLACWGIHNTRKQMVITG